MNNQFSRQADIVPRDRIDKCIATVIGVGAIGRQVALQLTAMGISHLQLIDFDRVEIHNLATQGYLTEDIKHLKVDATSVLCRQMNKDVVIGVVPDRFKRTMVVGNSVFCCVDSITARKHIWDAVKDKVSFFCDGRMSAEVLRIITACDSKSRTYYPQTLFSQEQAHAGPCTAKSTIYCANIAAGLMLAQFTKHLRMLPVDADIQVNLLACEMNVEPY
jgi:sulfur carrier protein ThiS adenylyltransferase